MTVLVTAATPDDLAEASGTMRGVLDEALSGYRPEWHHDLDDLQGTYLDDPRRHLVVARLHGEQHGDLDGHVVGTAGVRPCALRTPPNPAWLAERYGGPEVCELVRVWIDARARRQGVAGALVREAVAWAVGAGGYRTVYLHTDASAPGAEAFWRSLPTVEVHDARPDPFNCVHFELDAVKLLAS